MAQNTLRLKVDDRTFQKRAERMHFLVDSPTSPVADLLKRGFNQHIRGEYSRILRREMPPSREIKTLNEGFIVRQGKEIIALPAGRVKRKVGRSDNGRFIRANWTPIAQAVASETPQVDLQAPRGILRVGAVSLESVQRKNKFRWFIRDSKGRIRGRGETDPFAGRWLHALEEGGTVRVPNFGRALRNPRITRATQYVGDSGQMVRRRGKEWQWIVEPRNKRKRLWPEDKVWVWKMRKTVTPIGMFRRALFTRTRPLMRQFIPDFIKLTSQVSGFARGEGLSGGPGALP